MDVKHQFNFEFVQQECDMESFCKYLEVLSNDRLLDFFSKNSLQLMDLCGIGEACEQYRNLCRPFISKKIRLFVDLAVFFIEEHRGTSEEILTYKYSSNGHNYKLGKFLRNFGRDLASVSVEYFDPFNRGCGTTIKRIWDDIASYPRDISRKLDFQVYKNDVSIIEINPFTIRLSDLDIDGHDSLFIYSNSLVNLSISDVKNDKVILQNYYPELKRFEYEITVKKADDSSDALTSFLSRHPTLKSFHLWVAYKLNDSLRTILWEEIGNNCMDLEELDISIGKTTYHDIHALQKLTSLKSLTLSDYFCGFGSLSHFTQLQELSLNNCVLIEHLNDFNYLRKLIKLDLFSCYAFDGRYVTRMITQLINLEKLKIYGGQFVLGIKTYIKIAKVVKDRPNVLTLECNFNFVNFDEYPNIVLL